MVEVLSWEYWKPKVEAARDADLRHELIKRKRDAERCRFDVDLQQRVRALCARDPAWWVNNWCWTYDPRIPAILPFVLWEKQEECLHKILQAIREQRDLLIDKSRDQGLTWIAGAAAVHGWLFQDLVSFGFHSRNQDLVDKKGDPDSIFDKLRTLIDTQPAWMLPRGWGDEYDNYGRIINPENGSTLKGLWGKEVGRGGRSTAVFPDEFAFGQDAETADRALSQTTRSRVYISTPNGIGNLFYRKRHAENGPEVFTVKWDTDPRKNLWVALMADGSIVTGHGPMASVPEEVSQAAVSIVHPWYEAEKIRLEDDPVALAQEVDIDYTASLEGVIIEAKWVEAAVLLHKRFLFPDFHFKIAALDVSDGGKSENVFIERRGPIIDLVECWIGESAKSSFTPTTKVETGDRAIELCYEREVALFFYDAPGSGGLVGTALRKRRQLPFAWRGINTGVDPTEARHADGRTSKERFDNLKAELWWAVRRRFQKTYRFVTEGIEYPLDELISIPDDRTLKTQLSTPTWFTNEDGKICVESKKDLKKRDVASPDRADALVLLFSPMPTKKKATSGGRRESVQQFKPR